MDPLPLLYLQNVSRSLFLFLFIILHIPDAPAAADYCAELCPIYCRRPSGDQLPGDLEVCQNAEKVRERFDLLVPLARQTVEMYRNTKWFTTIDHPVITAGTPIQNL